MIVRKDEITFESSDMRFVKRCGIENATEIVRRHYDRFSTPFIGDMFQLSAFLRIKLKELHEITDHIEQHYTEIHIPKRHGGFRILNRPDDQLDRLQRIILNRILNKMDCSPYATAYHKGAKLIDNASPHVGKRYLLKTDVADFFGSIRFDKVYQYAFPSIRYPKEVGTFLTMLCCLGDVLPQGTCTSPALSNLFMQPFDNSFSGWCKKRGFNYTRYCDDITVSGDNSLYPAYLKAKELLSQRGLLLNEDKTHFITDSFRQTVTGLTVNEKVNVTADYKRKLRQELYYADRFGIESAAQFLHQPDAQKYYQQLMGRLNFVLSIEPDHTYFINAKEKLSEKRAEII